MHVDAYFRRRIRASYGRRYIEHPELNSDSGLGRSWIILAKKKSRRSDLKLAGHQRWRLAVRYLTDACASNKPAAIVGAGANESRLD